jgi:hypothetical protein
MTLFTRLVLVIMNISLDTNITFASWFLVLVGNWDNFELLRLFAKLV